MFTAPRSLSRRSVRVPVSGGRALRAGLLTVALAVAGATVPAGAAHAVDAPTVLRGVYAGPVGPLNEVPVTLLDEDDQEYTAYPGGACASSPLTNDPTNKVRLTTLSGNFTRPPEPPPFQAQAGGSSDMCIAFYVPKNTSADGDDMKEIAIDLPRGFQAQPGSAGACTSAEFGVNPDGSQATWPAVVDLNNLSNGCPASSIIGATRTAVRIPGLDIGEEIARSSLYNLKPTANEFARLGVEVKAGTLSAPVRVVVRLVLTSDHRLRAIASMPRTAAILTDTAGGGTLRSTTYSPIMISGVGILAFGKKTDRSELSAPFFVQHGTECGRDLNASFHLTTYSGLASSAVSPSYQVTGCGALPFAPSVSVSNVTGAPGGPTPLTVDVNVPQAPSLPRTSLIKDVSVALPAGLEVGAQVASGASGLPLCSAAQFRLGEAAAPACPAASAVGEVTINTPLINEPLVGKVFLGPQPAVGELPALYVEAGFSGATLPDAPTIKLVGSTKVAENGQITATFPDNPQLRFNKIQLRFAGGEHALFVAPRTCGTTTGAFAISPSSGTATVAGPIVLKTETDCTNPAFAPTVGFTATSPQAAASAPSQITIERGDRQPWLGAIAMSLPAGFLADLNGPTECSAASAATGACPESSRMGSITAMAGTGPAPLSLPGSIYLTERQNGNVAGAVIVVKATIGGIELGDVVVPAAIKLRPLDAGLDFSADMPTRFKGLALNLRKVVVDLDRQGFALNPSACGPLPYSAVVTSDGGETVTPAGSVAYTGCGALPFGPKLQARLTGEIAPLSHPGMFVRLTKIAQDSNLKSATVVLPEGVAADLKNVQVSCSREQFDAVACPANTRVGGVGATVSITTERISGDVYLVKVPGETLPGLGLSFNGRFAQRVMSVVKINPQGRLIVRFDAIPDIPLRDLVVDVAGGAKGPLQLGKEDCANGTQWDATFVGQGGQVAKDQTGLRCAARSIVKLSDKTGLTLRNFDFGGRNLKSAKITLPSGWSINTKKAKSKKNFARLTGGTTKPKYTKRSMTMAIKGTKASTLRVKLLGSVIAKKSKAKKAKTVAVKVRFVFTDGAVQNQTIKTKAR